MNSKEIQNRQNEDQFLKIQYAAREYFNSAEKLNHYVWLLCVASAFWIFLPNNLPVLILNGIPFVVDIIVFIFTLLVNHRVKMAAKLRKCFDAYVLDICPEQFSETELREIREISGKMCLKYPDEAKKQMDNTGKDSPPGVREWYVFLDSYDEAHAQLECQRQNVWWNKKVFIGRIFVTICVTILVGLVFLVLMAHNGILSTMLCSAGLMIKLLERLIENGRYVWVSARIDGALQVLEVGPTRESIEKLQGLIDERRSIPVLEFNWIHNRKANLWSKEYEDSLY